MFDYDAERLRDIILELTRSALSSEAGSWFQEKLALKDNRSVNTTFSLIPRKCGKDFFDLDHSVSESISQIKPGFSLQGWTADRPQEHYFATIENLFLAAEMEESAALYSALPLLAYPELWVMRCAEGIRSNIGTVLEAVMYHNPYPATQLDDKAWNQLVMKAVFTDKDLSQIYGLHERANQELALMISDYAHERWAAGRKLTPQLWPLTAKFIDDRILRDLEKVLEEGDPDEKEAAELTLRMRK
jgi:hypothetical protein